MKFRFHQPKLSVDKIRKFWKNIISIFGKNTSMKNFLVLVLLSLLGWMNAQQKIERLDTSKVSSKNQLENNNFYLVDDASKLLYLMKSSDKKFKMVYTFTDWCKPCREKFPQILQFEKEFQQVVDVFYVTDIYRESLTQVQINI